MQDSAGRAQTSAGEAVPRDDRLSSAGELERAAPLILFQQSLGALDTEQHGMVQRLLQCFPLKQLDQTTSFTQICINKQSAQHSGTGSPSGTGGTQIERRNSRRQRKK